MSKKKPLHLNYDTSSNSPMFIGLFQFPISGHTWSEHGTLITKTDYPNFVVARNSFRMANKILYLPFTGGVNSNKRWESGHLEIFPGNRQ